MFRGTSSDAGLRCRRRAEENEGINNYYAIKKVRQKFWAREMRYAIGSLEIEKSLVLAPKIKNKTFVAASI